MRLHSVILSFLAIAVGGLRADEVCETTGCLEIAKVFQDYMDTSVDPCDDFYRFVCGNFLENAVIPDWDEVYSIYSSVEDDIRQQLIHELVAETISGQPPSFQKAKDYYQACMDTDNIEQNSITSMKERLDTYGGWPVLEDDWNEDDFDWIESTKKMLLDGLPGDQMVTIGRGFDNDQPDSTFTVGYGDHYLDDDTLRQGLDPIVQQYLEVLVDIAVAFGADRDQAEKDMTEVVKLEMDLANLIYTPVEIPATKMPETISELQDVWSYLPWLEFIQDSFKFDAEITGDINVEILSPHYLTNLKDMLPNIPNRTLANYIMSRVVFNGRYYLNQEVLDISWRLEQVDGGSISVPPRSEYCIDDMLANMAVTLAAMYVRKYVSPDIKKEAEKIVDMLQDQFVKIIANEDWITDESKNQSMEKVKSIVDDIAYPDELLDDTIVDEYHVGLNVTPSNYYDNYVAILNWWLYLDAKTLQSPGDLPLNWWYLPFDQIMTVQNDYDPDDNSMVLYAGQLQSKFFSLDRPMHVNLGIMGSVAAQQLPAALDDYARITNINGNQEDLWDQASSDAYDARIDAIANAYSTYVVKEVNMTLDGDLIVYTAIGDQGGNKIARMTLDTWQSQSGQKEPKLKGLEKYSYPQMFWMGVALNSCAKSRPEWLRFAIENLEEATDEFRVNGPFRQSEQFAQDWECPVGSYMNPKDKFNMW